MIYDCIMRFECYINFIFDLCLFIFYSIIYLICPKSYQTAVIVLFAIPP